MISSEVEHYTIIADFMGSISRSGLEFFSGFNFTAAVFM